jgi:hypothetical protein
VPDHCYSVFYWLIAILNCIGDALYFTGSLLFFIVLVVRTCIVLSMLTAILYFTGSSLVFLIVFTRFCTVLSMHAASFLLIAYRYSEFYWLATILNCTGTVVFYTDLAHRILLALPPPFLYYTLRQNEVSFDTYLIKSTIISLNRKVTSGSILYYKNSQCFSVSFY